MDSFSCWWASAVLSTPVPVLNFQSRTCSFCLISLSRLFLWKSTYSMRYSAAILDCFAGGFCVCPPSSWIERHFKCQGCLVPFVFSWALLSTDVVAMVWIRSNQQTHYAHKSKNNVNRFSSKHVCFSLASTHQGDDQTVFIQSSR